MVRVWAAASIAMLMSAACPTLASAEPPQSNSNKKEIEAIKKELQDKMKDIEDEQSAPQLNVQSGTQPASNALSTPASPPTRGKGSTLLGKPAPEAEGSADPQQPE